MGWTFSTRPTTKQQFVKSLLADYANSSQQILDSSLRGSQLWVLARSGNKPPFICLFLLRCQDGCWGYKDMDESMGPYYYNCPVTFLDRAPEPQGSNLDHQGSGRSWRSFVREAHAYQRQRKSNKPRVGDVIQLDPQRYPSCQRPYRVTQDLGRRGLMLDDHWRLNVHEIKYATVLAQ